MSTLSIDPKNSCPFLFLLEFNDLHNDLFSELSDTDLALRLSLVCKKCLGIANQEILWKKRIVCKLNNQAAMQFFNVFKNWKVAYIYFKQMSKTGTVVSPHEILDTNGITYIGKFRDGKLSGKGKMIIADKTTYDGQFKDGVFINGTKTSADGNLIETGQFQENQLQGKGKRLYRQNGDVLEGVFQKGQFHGRVNIHFANGTYTYRQLPAKEKKFSSNKIKNSRYDHIPNKISSRSKGNPLPYISKQVRHFK